MGHHNARLGRGHRRGPGSHGFPFPMSIAAQGFLQACFALVMTIRAHVRQGTSVMNRGLFMKCPRYLTRSMAHCLHCRHSVWVRSTCFVGAYYSWVLPRRRCGFDRSARDRESDQRDVSARPGDPMHEVAAPRIFKSHEPAGKVTESACARPFISLKKSEKYYSQIEKSK